MSDVTAPTTVAEAAEISGWSRPVKLWQPRNPAFWLYLWLVVNGAFVFASGFSEQNVDSSTLAIALASQVGYALLYVFFFARADRYDRVPGTLLAMAFVFGGLFSTWLIASPANGPLITLWSKWVSVDFARDWGPALTAPLTEETGKLAAVIICVLLSRRHVRSAYDGLMLGMFAGLGFQVFENATYMLNAAAGNFNSEPILDMAQSFLSRGATGVFGHWLWTAIAGAGVGYYVGNPDKSKAHRLGVAGGLLLIVMLAHGLWDATLGLGFLALPAAIVLGVISLVMVLRYTERQSRSWVGTLLAEDTARGTVTEDELAYLTGTLRERRKYIRSIKRSEGKAAAKQAEWVLTAQNELAAAIAATEDPHSPEAEDARAEVARLRTTAV